MSEAVTFFLAILILPIVGVAFGAFAGWAVGLFFENSIRHVMSDFGIHTDASMLQIGAFLGFVGGYFKR